LQNIASGASIVHIKTIGREEPTTAEGLRHQLLANVLQGQLTILDHRFVQTIFFPELLSPWPKVSSKRVKRQISMAKAMPLNGSQTLAVETIISLEDRHRVVLVHGPPGTGKTTVIAASTQSIVACDLDATVWLVAHSNVAVKNIAEKLVNSDFLDFKIIVSKEFHFDWFVPLLYSPHPHRRS
jgi:regulator of nonsense transcripts 1